MKTSLHNQRGALGVASGYQPQHNDALMYLWGVEGFHADALRRERLGRAAPEDGRPADDGARAEKADEL